MSKLAILSAPEGFDFEFSIIDGVLKIANLKVQDQKWEIPGVESLLDKAMVIVGYSLLTSRIESVLLSPEGDILHIMSVDFVPNLLLEWTVSLSEFNQLIKSSKTEEKVAPRQESGASFNPPGSMWVDNGPE